MNKAILIISDTHIPYHHPDLIPFLQTLRKLLKPDRVIHIGDEVDHHAIHFWDIDPDLPSPGDEHKISLSTISQLETLFPKLDLLDSNHGSLVYRRALKYGIPKAYLKSYNDYLNVGKGWKWHDDLTLSTPGGEVYFCHGKMADISKLAQHMGMSAVQGHYHSISKLSYHSTPMKLYFGLQVGCLIDKKALAFKYNKVQRQRPIIDCAAIIEGLPKIIPMPLNKHGRWTGKIDL